MGLMLTNVYRMKKALQATLQRLLGFDRYLVLFAHFKILTLRWDGPRQEGDFNFFLRMLPAHAICLDIGANIGIMTVLMARQAPQGNIFAFEPVPANYRALKRVVKSYGLRNVSLHPIALGDRPRRVRMTMPLLQGVRMQGLSHVEHDSIEGYDAQADDYHVDQMPLDELDFLQDQPIHAIKMDVENYEQFVLMGGKSLIRRQRPLIYCELWDNENRRRCFDILQELGYRIHVLDHDTLLPFEPERHPHHNFFFLPPEA